MTRIDDSQTPLVFDSQRAWADWLAKHHDSSTGVWLRIARTSSKLASVTYAEALESALCHGWIDGQKKSDGPTHWLQRFTPRTARSIWSKVNREKALALIERGEMTPAGRREVERAKADGRWERAYDSHRTSTVPDDLLAAMDARPGARRFFDTLDARNRYAILWRVQTAKKSDTRARRIATLAEMLARHEKLHP